MKKKVREPEYFSSATNLPTLNYQVYYMKPAEKLLNFLLAFAVGAAVGYIFYGGIGKDSFGNPTTLTYVLNILLPGIAGIAAGILYLPIRTRSILEKRRRVLAVQFRDMLDALTASLGAGKNVTDSFIAVYDDLKLQYEPNAYILKEIEVILSGLQNNIPIEDILLDFGTRSGNADILSFANVFKVGYRKGGNIKDIIRNTHAILSDKMEIAEDIETIVASNKTEQSIMIAMPILLVAVIKLSSPDFAANFVSKAGILSTTISIGVFIGAYFIGKAVLDIKV